MERLIIRFVLALLLYKYIGTIHGWRPFVVHVDNLTTESFTPKCRVNSSVTYPGLMNINFYFSETVTAKFSHINIFLESGNGKYDLELMNRSVDMCRLFKDVAYEPILQVGLRLYRYNSTFLKNCVIKKGLYSLKNLLLNVEHLPPIFPEKSGYYDHTYYISKGNPLANVKLFFSVNKVYKKN